MAKHRFCKAEMAVRFCLGPKTGFPLERAEALIYNFQGMAKITIFTTPSCVYCKMAKEFFKENNFEYMEKDVARDLEARKEMMERSGQMGVSVIDINGQLVVGFNREKISELLGL